MHAAFLADIRENPEDDAPRLIYADWLEDHGEEEQAEFIRVQVEESRLHVCGCAPSLFVAPDCPVCKAVRPLRARWRELLSGLYGQFRPTSDDSWGVLATHRGGTTPASFVRRGFVHTVRCPTATWLAHRVELVRRHPLQRVELTNREPARSAAGKRYWHNCEHCFREGATYAVNTNLVGEYDGNPLYDTPEQANRWLSDALLKEARRLAKELEKKEMTQ